MVSPPLSLSPARLALGTVQWGLRYGIANRTGQPHLREVRAILAVAESADVSFLDTARVYGASEQVIGMLIGGNTRWTVTTKLAPDVWQSGQSNKRTLAKVQASLEASRRALNRPKLDGVLLHRAEHRHAAGGLIWDALCRERDLGRIEMLGVSAGAPTEAFDALEDPNVQMIQVATNLFDQRLYRAGFFPRARQNNRTVVVRSVFLQGVAHLSPEELPAYLSAARPCLELVHAWSQDHGVSPAQAFLQFARSIEGIIVLLGCETCAQLRTNLDGWQQERIGGTTFRQLADSIPELPETALNPARWAAAA